jgi:ATP-dependent protease ClpP protease subunit
MVFEVFRSAGSVLTRVGVCDLRSLSARSFEVLHEPTDPVAGTRRPIEAHAFEVIDLRDERGERPGLLARDHANPSVLPGWRAV